MTSKLIRRFTNLNWDRSDLLELYDTTRLVNINPDRLVAEVNDKSTGKTHTCSVHVIGHEAITECDCNHSTNELTCMHLVELLDYMEWSGFPWPPGKLTIVTSSPSLAWKSVFRSSAQTPKASFTPRSPEAQLHYVLDVPQSMESGKTTLFIYMSKLGKRGDWLKPRLRQPRGIPLGSLSPQDATLLEMLRSFQPKTYYYSEVAEVEIPRPVSNTVLRQLAESERLYWTIDHNDMETWNQARWSDEVWKFKLSLDKHPEGWAVRARFVLGDRTMELTEPVLADSEGLLLMPDQFLHYEPAAEAFPWISNLRDHNELIVPAEDTDELLEQIQSNFLESSIFELPEDLRYAERVGLPVPRAQINKPTRGNRKLSVDVDFLYDNHPASGKIAYVDHESRTVVQRDREAEQRHFEVIQQCEEIDSAQPHELAPEHLAQVVAMLTHAGWHVEADGNLLRHSSGVSISVNSGVDWFDLHGEFDFDGKKVSIPKVLSAMRRGEKFIKLDDGSQGLLPEEWLQRFGDITNLGEADGDALRFTMPQAALLDSLLAAQDNVRLDAKFRHYQEKLRSFSGIQPATAHRNFRGELRHYQQQGLGWMKFLREFQLGGCLADDMGLGKTVQVLAMLQAERARRPKKDEPRAPSLIVVPRSLLFNWINEAERFAPQLKVLEYFGTQRADLHDELDDYDVIVTTYGVVRRDIELLMEMQFHYVVLDEAQAIKNNQSQAAKACRLLHARHRLALTGTPVENHLGELWSLFEFLNPGLLGRNESFMKLARRAKGETSALNAIADGIAPFVLRRTKTEVLTELPAKTEQTLHCEMHPKQRKLYDELRDYYRTVLSGKVADQGLNRSKIHVLEALLRLRQCACHPLLLDESSKAPSAKLDVLMDQIASVVEDGHKALVFSQFTKLLAIVRRELDHRQLRHEYLDGRTRKREDRVKAFQEDPDCPLFLISLKAGGHGLNLTAADYVFILDPWWNPAVEAQAIDRAHRIGQDKPVFAYRLICKDTVEDKILALQQDKRQLADAIVRGDSSIMQNLTAEDLAVLLS
ncbi:MAG: SNF2 helicase associated domain-containing protein [Planctomycetales bacterium]|nr:SNF2 helicase associated domain-containing protein [Planctomycetales bacterium]